MVFAANTGTGRFHLRGVFRINTSGLAPPGRTAYLRRNSAHP